MIAKNILEQGLDTIIRNLYKDFEDTLLSKVLLPKVEIQSVRNQDYRVKFNNENYLVTSSASTRVPSSVKILQPVHDLTSYSDDLQEVALFHELREKEYKDAKFLDAHQRALNESTLYALKYLDLDTQLHYFTHQEDSPSLIVPRIEIELRLGRGRESWRTYSLIPVRNGHLSFFPGYGRNFTLQTDVGEIETHLTSAATGTRRGMRTGSYITTGLKPWYTAHPELQTGDFLTVDKLEPQRYKLSIRKTT